MSEELMIPEFLEKRTFEDIMEEMINGLPEEKGLPEDIDVSEGSHAYNLLAPTAMQMEYFAGYVLGEAIKMIFPKYCEGYDQIVDYHADSTGIPRGEAVKATGKLKIIGPIGTEILEGTAFSTYSTDETPAIQFLSTQDAIITKPLLNDASSGNGEVEIDIEAEEAGAAGNVKAGSIHMFDDEEIHQVEQTADMSNGADQQSTEDLIKEIVEYEASQGISYVGCAADYKKWAEDVPGVGNATIISPEDGSGLVKIIVTTSDGNMASETLCAAVKEYIMPANFEARRAPINAKIEVESAQPISFFVNANIEMSKTGVNVDVEKEKGLVIDRFIESIETYLKTVMDGDRIIRYQKVASLLSGTVGIYDFNHLQLGKEAGSMGTENISIQGGEIPSITMDNVSFNISE